jgi:hypothetical protein
LNRCTMLFVATADCAEEENDEDEEGDEDE